MVLFIGRYIRERKRCPLETPCGMYMCRVGMCKGIWCSYTNVFTHIFSNAWEWLCPCPTILRKYSCTVEGNLVNNLLNYTLAPN